MNEYEKALFDYIMTNKMDKSMKRREYLLAVERERTILEDLYNGLTSDQRRQFRRYEEECSEKAIVDLEQMFLETLSAVRTLPTTTSL